jgi:hypothetical protein
VKRGGHCSRVERLPCQTSGYFGCLTTQELKRGDRVAVAIRKTDRGIMSRIFKISLVALGCLAPLPALGADDEVAAKARTLAKEAQADSEAGRFEAAAEKLTQAYQLAKVPALARNIARALVKQGKLVAASRYYQEALDLQPNSLWRLQIQQTAQRDAAAERTELMNRLPSLRIQIEGAPAREATLSIDGALIDPERVGTAQPVDPGSHRLVAKYGTQVVERTVEVKEGERRQEVLQLPTAPAAQPAPVSQPPNLQAHGGARRGLQPTLGWIGIGVGAAGLALGATTGIIAGVKLSSLRNDGCRDNWCPSNLSGRVDGYNTLRTISTVGLVAGAVVEVAGITLLLTSPRRSGDFALMVGPQHVAIKGGF